MRAKKREADLESLPVDDYSVQPQILASLITLRTVLAIGNDLTPDTVG